MRILIVEDTARLSALLAEALVKHGFASDCAPTLAAADEAIAATSHDAIVLDLGLPDGDGLNWLGRRRRNSTLPPVLALTARGTLAIDANGMASSAQENE